MKPLIALIPFLSSLIETDESVTQEEYKTLQNAFAVILDTQLTEIQRHAAKDAFKDLLDQWIGSFERAPKRFLFGAVYDVLIDELPSALGNCIEYVKLKGDDFHPSFGDEFRGSIGHA